MAREQHLGKEVYSRISEYQGLPQVRHVLP
jgi:hypothetical protein